MKIALIADTHVGDRLPRLPVALFDHLVDVDLILHAGDFTTLDVLTQLKESAETIAVCGNWDSAEIAAALPRKQTVTAMGKQIGLIHGHLPVQLEQAFLGQEIDYDSPLTDEIFAYVASEFPEADIIVFGHFHIPIVKKWGQQLIINPGSIGPPHERSTIAMLKLSAASIEDVATFIEIEMSDYDYGQ